MKNNGKRLYLENTLSQQLIVLFIVGNTMFTVFHVNSMSVTAQLGTFIMLNIVLSLLAFLMAVQQKVYASRWAYVGIVVGLFQLARLLWIPAEITGSMRLFLQILLLITGIALLVASIICIRRSKERQTYIEKHNIDVVTLQK